MEKLAFFVLKSQVLFVLWDYSNGLSSLDAVVLPRAHASNQRLSTLVYFLLYSSWFYFM
eukprot:m.18272 g.18272  ORF g.18272 m.18272 type:complete len:59 (-) comp8462_c0_seq2:1414-1590(-)